MARRLLANSDAMTQRNRTLGTRAFAAICAVEGLALAARSKRRLARLRKQGLSNEEIRASIIEFHRTSPNPSP